MSLDVTHTTANIATLCITLSPFHHLLLCNLQLLALCCQLLAQALVLEGEQVAGEDK